MTSVNHFARPATGQRGFSLMELMLTLVIAATLMGVAVPAFRGLINSNRVVTQSNDIVAALNLARSEAITRNAAITFCAADSSTSTSCNTTATNWAAWVVLNGTTLLRGGDINNYGSTLKVFASLTNNTATYSSDGLARTGSTLINTEAITVCTTFTKIDKNIYTISPGRISTVTTKSTC